jgi:hypothetical protein
MAPSCTKLPCPSEVLPLKENFRGPQRSPKILPRGKPSLRNLNNMSEIDILHWLIQGTQKRSQSYQAPTPQTTLVLNPNKTPSEYDRNTEPHAKIKEKQKILTICSNRHTGRRRKRTRNYTEIG